MENSGGNERNAFSNYDLVSEKNTSIPNLIFRQKLNFNPSVHLEIFETGYSWPQLKLNNNDNNNNNNNINSTKIKINRQFYLKKLLKSYLQLIRLKKKKKLFIQKHYLQFLSI